VDTIVPVLIGAAVLGFLSLLLWAAQVGRPAPGPEPGDLLFRHGPLLRGFSLFAAFGVPLAVTVLVFFKPPKDDGDVWAIIGIYSLFGVISAPLLWESMRFALVVSPEGLDCCSPWRRGRFLAWDEVQDVSYSATSSWFVIQATDGWKFRVPILVPGLTHFLEACERHLPVAALTGAFGGYMRVRRPFPSQHQIDLPDDDVRSRWGGGARRPSSRPDVTRGDDPGVQRDG
jgi:hypothetical protein